MSRIDYRLILYYFLVFVALQLPLLYKFVFFDSAFGFFYLGFLLLLPFGINPFTRLIIGFFIGLTIDVFSNTPGLHASASTFIMLIRDRWLTVVRDDLEEDVNLSVLRLGFRGSVIYMMPLILLHFILIFSIEHGKMQGFGLVLKRIIFSGIFTFVCIVIFNFLVAKRPRRI